MKLYEVDGIGLTKSANETPEHYIFQGEDGNGFVIVAADDACNPIIAYSFDGALPDGGLPDNMRAWLQWIDDQIRFVRDNKIEASPQVKKQWQFTKAGGAGNVLTTAQWNQIAPYNEKCPDDGADRSLTGCVATATAIVMRYHKWPKEGKGRTEEYYTETKKIKVQSRNLEHSYDWSNMPLDYNNTYTNAQAREVAVLMADIGAAFKADYTSESTSASYNTGVLYRNFGYSSSMRFIARESYGNEEWATILKNEINAKRPVLYSGNSEGNDGHAFVIDGYDNGGFFHINWGWGGDNGKNADGFYSLNYLVPNETYSFNDNQSAIINVKPADENDKIKNWLTFMYRGLYCYSTRFESGVPFNIGINLYNNSDFDFSGDIILAVTDRNGNIKEILKEYNYKSFWGLNTQQTVVVEGEITVGDRIRAFYKSENETDWSVITSVSGSVPWEILIAKEYYLHEITSFTYDNEHKEVEIKTRKDAVVKLYDPDGNDVTDKIDRYDVYAYFGTDSIKDGRYRIVVTSDSESVELFFSIKY
jgi:hypothetical protein